MVALNTFPSDGKYRVPARHVRGESLMGMCSEMGIVIGNTFFKKKESNKFTWQRIDNGRLVERAVMD